MIKNPFKKEPDSEAAELIRMYEHHTIFTLAVLSGITPKKLAKHLIDKNYSTEYLGKVIEEMNLLGKKKGYIS